MSTIAELFAPQIEANEPVTQVQLDEMIQNRENSSRWSPEQVEQYFAGVVPGVSKQLFYVVDFPNQYKTEVRSCWDHQIPLIEEAYALSTKGGTQSTGGRPMPRLIAK